MEAGLVAPLGVFGAAASQLTMERLADQLRSLSGHIPLRDRKRIATYLRAGRMIIPLMEYTRDVVASKFGVSGGSAIQTDGIYYWRRDAAEYVEEYGVALPDEFINHGNARHWHMPPITEGQLVKIDQYLAGHIRRLA